MRSSFVWRDLITPDSRSVQGFYQSLFGWSFEDHGTCLICRKGDAQIARMNDKRDSTLPVSWVSHLRVESVEAAFEWALVHGGMPIMSPMDIGDDGYRSAIIVDPVGALLFLFEGRSVVGADPCDGHGTVIWNELLTPDLQLVADFYTSLVGWEICSRKEYAAFSPHGAPYATVKGENCSISQREIPRGIWSLFFAVDDVYATIAKAEKLGGKVAVSPANVDKGRVAYIADPLGAPFGILDHGP